MIHSAFIVKYILQSKKVKENVQHAQWDEKIIFHYKFRERLELSML